MHIYFCKKLMRLLYLSINFYKKIAKTINYNIRRNKIFINAALQLRHGKLCCHNKTEEMNHIHPDHPSPAPANVVNHNSDTHQNMGPISHVALFCSVSVCVVV